MKITTDNSLSKRGATPRRSELGILLMDCVVYMGLFFLISGLAFSVFYACWDNAKHLRRNTDEIVGALNAGERWRAEVRNATASLSTEDSPEGRVLRIPQKTGEIDYRFSGEALWRRAGSNAEWMEALPKIKSSRMEADQRRQVTAWRWEVELLPQRKQARVTPLFTFEAVPQPAIKP